MVTDKSQESYLGLGKVPIGIGAMLKGWDISEEDFRNPDKLPVVDARTMTKACPHDCFQCFVKDSNVSFLLDDGNYLRGEEAKSKFNKFPALNFDEIINVIDQLAALNTHAIDYLGEGEPTLDKNFFRIIEYTSSKSIIPVVFTDAATKLRDKEFIKRMYDSGASICLKCDSLFNEDYENWVVGNNAGNKTNSYFRQRNDALKLLMEHGFNQIEKDGTTRLGFDMVVSSKNINEVEKTLRYCRENNLWIVFSFYLPTGKSASDKFDKSLMVSEDDKKVLRETVARVDAEYSFNHPIWNNFATMPCVEFLQIYGNGSVSPCPGNELIFGNVRTESIKDLERKIIAHLPCHDRTKVDGSCLGSCLYRP